MQWLSALDVALFRWINRDLAHPLLDLPMRWLSGNRFFVPALVVIGALLLWKGGKRGWIFVLLVAAAAGLANEFIAEPLKDGIRRARPYAALDDVFLRVGRGNPIASMPSAHALNAALMATVAGWYYRRALWVVAPLAFGVGLSRVYNGVHFPADVLAGFVLGTGFGLLFIALADRVWRRLAPRWLPGIAGGLPNLLDPPPQPQRKLRPARTAGTGKTGGEDP